MINNSDNKRSRLFSPYVPGTILDTLYSISTHTNSSASIIFCMVEEHWELERYLGKVISQ